MKELTFNDIWSLIEYDSIAIFKGGWGKKNIVYEDTLTYDDEKYQDFIKEYGNTPIRCISTSVNTTIPEKINIAILI